MSNTRKRRHGLKGGGSWHARQHTDVTSQEHLEFQERKKLMRGDGYTTRLVPVELARWGPKPELLEVKDAKTKDVKVGNLTTPGNKTWLLETKDDGSVGLKSVPGTELVEFLDAFDAEVEAAGGPMRLGPAKKTGGHYLQRAEKMENIQRNTIDLPMWVSYAWSRMPPAARESVKDDLIKCVFELVRARWPAAELKGLSLHDDTRNLHFDIWASQLKQDVEIKKGVEKKVFVSKGRVFTSGLAGPGIMFLDLKRRAGHELHKMDQEKLDEGLNLYAHHRQRTAKDLPEVPAEIEFGLKLDEILTEFWESRGGGEIPIAAKKVVKSYWKALDKYNYGRVDEVDALKKELDALKKELQAKHIAVDSKKEELEGEAWVLKTEKQAFESEMATIKAELSSSAEMYKRAEGTRVWMCNTLLKKPKALQIIAEDPTALLQLHDHLKPSSHPTVKKAYALVLEIMDKRMKM